MISMLGHLFAWEARRLRPMLLLFALTLLAGVLAEGVRASEIRQQARLEGLELIPLLTALVAALSVVKLLQGSSPLSPTAFHHGKPIDGRLLAVAKLLVLVVGFVIMPLLVLAACLAFAGMPSSIPTAFQRALPIWTIWLGAATAAGVVTLTVARAVLVFVLAAISVFLTVSWFVPSAFGYIEAFGAVVGGAITIILLFRSHRAIAHRRLQQGGAVVACALLVGALATEQTNTRPSAAVTRQLLIDSVSLQPDGLVRVAYSIAIIGNERLRPDLPRIDLSLRVNGAALPATAVGIVELGQRSTPVAWDPQPDGSVRISGQSPGGNTFAYRVNARGQVSSGENASALEMIGTVSMGRPGDLRSAFRERGVILALPLRTSILPPDSRLDVTAGIFGRRFRVVDSLQLTLNGTPVQSATGARFRYADVDERGRRRRMLEVRALVGSRLLSDPSRPNLTGALEVAGAGSTATMPTWNGSSASRRSFLLPGVTQQVEQTFMRGSSSTSDPTRLRVQAWAAVGDFLAESTPPPNR